MKLRFLVVCDKHGQKTEPTLQFWDEEYEFWATVDTVEVKAWEEEKAEHDPDLY